MTVWWYLLVVVFGGLGAVVRVWATQAGEVRLPGGAPAMTAVVNVVGAALMGVVAAVSGNVGLLVLGGGLLSGMTTFSTWMVEIEDAQRGDRLRDTALLIVVPVVAGALAYAALRAIA